MFKKILKLIGVLILAAVITAVSIVVLGILGIRAGIPLPEDQITGLAGTLGFVPSAIFLCVLDRKNGWNSDLKERRIKLDIRVVPMSLFAISAGTILTGTIAALVFGRLFPITPGVSGHTLLDYIGSIVLAPVIEEMFFRAGVYGTMRKTINVKASMVISALIFSAIHMFSLQGALEAFAVGLILVIFYEKTGNLFYCIIAHMALNIFSNVSNALVRSGVPFYTEPNGYLIYHTVVIVVAVIVILLTAASIVKKGRKNVQSSCS